MTEASTLLRRTVAGEAPTPVFCAVHGAGGGSIAGFCAGLGEVEHPWMLPRCVGRGIGTLLFEKALAEARSFPEMPRREAAGGGTGSRRAPAR
jgi:GNAT superfamily N-acetyltransferase